MSWLGYTQEAIGAKLGWSQGTVSNYIMILDTIAPENLDLAKSNQIGRGANDAPNGAIEFTEG